MRKKRFIIIIKKYFSSDKFAFLQGKYKKRFSFALIFEKFCFNKQRM